jgi:hypothetical protein
MEPTIKTCSAVHIDVQCERNDIEDIACGGPVMLGYSFYIPKDVSLTDYKVFIRECLEKYKRPYINMVVTVKDRINLKYINDKSQIEETIRLESI